VAQFNLLVMTCYGDNNEAIMFLEKDARINSGPNIDFEFIMEAIKIEQIHVHPELKAKLIQLLRGDSDAARV